MHKFRVRAMIISVALGFIAPVLLLVAIFARFFGRKPIDVGLGPHPLINNVYHSRALKAQGYSAETFVTHTYFITNDFDIDLSERLKFLPKSLHRLLFSIVMFIFCLFRYKCLYLYFNGGPLSMLPGVLWYIEAHLLRLAGVKIVVMPYGGDVQDMSRSKNLFFKHTMTQSYPHYYRNRNKVIAQIDYWTQNADFVFSGVEWVDYQYHWNRLMLGHFSIDTSSLPHQKFQPNIDGPLRVLHAPNHRSIKGTESLLSAVNELREEGVSIELTTIEKQPNEVVLQAILDAEIVVDQLVIGWYAMFAIEAMGLGRPCVCFLRNDLLDLYRKAGLLEHDEMPLIQADTLTIKEVLKKYAVAKHELVAIGKKGTDFVRKHHSLESVGRVFDEVNRSIQLFPANTK